MLSQEKGASSSCAACHKQGVSKTLPLRKNVKPGEPDNIHSPGFTSFYIHQRNAFANLVVGMCRMMERLAWSNDCEVMTARRNKLLAGCVTSALKASPANIYT